jgi:hypothetical protein
VTAGDSEIGAALHFFGQVGNDFRGMLEVGIHDGENATLGDLPAADYRSREAALALSANDANLRESFGLGQGDFPRAVGAVVVDHDDFIPEIGDGIENRGELSDYGGDVFAFVVGGEDERDVDAGIAVGRGDYERTGGAGL